MTTVQATDTIKSNLASTEASALMKTPVQPGSASSPLLVDPALPSDPLLRKIINDVLHEAKYAFAVVAAAGQGGPAGGFGPGMQKYLGSRRPKTIDSYRAHAQALLTAPVVVRESHFGRYGDIAVSEYIAMGPAEVVKRTEGFLPRAAAGKALLSVDHPPVATSRRSFMEFPPGLPGEVDLAMGLRYKTLQFFVNSVQCIEQTSGLFEGADEISMGGTVVDAVGTTTPIGEFPVGVFEEGDVATYTGGGKIFGLFPLHALAPWPRYYNATVALAEKDDGGFAQFINDLWAAVKDKVIAAISAAGGVAAGAIFGSALGGALGGAIGAAIGLFIGWIISLFDNADDLVGVRNIRLSLAAATKSYYDWARLTTPGGLTLNLDFTGDGHYQVNCGFRLINP